MLLGNISAVAVEKTIKAKSPVGRTMQKGYAKQNQRKEKAGNTSIKKRVGSAFANDYSKRFRL